MIVTSRMPAMPEIPLAHLVTVAGVECGRVVKVVTKKDHQLVSVDIMDKPEVRDAIFRVSKHSVAFENMTKELWPEEYRLWRL